MNKSYNSKNLKKCPRGFGKKKKKKKRVDLGVKVVGITRFSCG